ncbi:PREDICTED: uncharacterized protein LOC106807760 [Priapulus caudatus]|uniref:Uncharacterized protein LOC106807760 n=1 Tax=Priapulus caudatus TaxID=37621 RepID=A0ABM1E0H6_PRICU|nr:PREDICTED: uncharacterized protein LOC106807760 [Priapulus caudatus]
MRCRIISFVGVLCCVALAEAFIDCRCLLPRGSAAGVTWFSVCSLPGREEKYAEQCPYGLTKDFCRCCDVCAKGPGEKCYRGFPAWGQPMGCAKNFICEETISGTYNYRCVKNTTAETLLESAQYDGGHTLDDHIQESGNVKAEATSDGKVTNVGTDRIEANDETGRTELTNAESDRIEAKTKSDRIELTNAGRLGTDRIELTNAGRLGTDRIETKTESDSIETKTESDRIESKTESDRIETKTESDRIEAKTESDRIESKTESDRIEANVDIGSVNVRENVDVIRSDYKHERDGADKVSHGVDEEPPTTDDGHHDVIDPLKLSFL